MRRIGTHLVLLAMLILSGCATGRYTQPSPQSDYRTQADKSLIIFMRPSNVGGAISSALFEVNNSGQDTLIGIIGPNEKMTYYTTPRNNKQFMVISENADFMDANLEAGKVYYAIVTPRMGVWRARFSLHPFKRAAKESEFQLNSEDMTDWLNECQFVIPNEASYTWAANNASSINTKKTEYLVKWQRMPESDKQWRRLEPNDGVDSPL